MGQPCRCRKCAGLRRSRFFMELEGDALDALLCLRQPVSQTRLSLPSCLEYMGNDDAFPSRLASPGMCAAYSPLEAEAVNRYSHSSQ